LGSGPPLHCVISRNALTGDFAAMKCRLISISISETNDPRRRRNFVLDGNCAAPSHVSRAFPIFFAFISDFSRIDTAILLASRVPLWL
jgi:hypothetical protein